MKTIYYIPLLLIIIFSTSCKTQKENVKPATAKEQSTVKIKEMNFDKKEEEKPFSVTPASIDAQKVNELAQKKAALLCSLEELKTELEKTSDQNRKIEINNEIGNLKNQIAEFDSVIKESLPDQELIDEVGKKVRFLVKDC